MLGICIVRHSQGFAVSNEAKFDEDRHLIQHDGQRFTKKVFTIKINSIFDVKGVVTVGQQVECLFKSEDEEHKYAFAGIVKLRGKELTVVHELKKIDSYNQILNHIKK